jgi:alpha-galactosidase
MIPTTFLLLFVCLLHVSSLHSLNNGLALLPPMGWSTWNVFRCDYDIDDLKTMVDAIVSSGLRDAGYKYFNVDDCWEGPRDAKTGMLTYNATKFPRGIKEIADYVHNSGLLFGIYSSSGAYTCTGHLGSWGYETQDAKLFASYEADFVKLDFCYQNSLEERKLAYSAMSNALQATGRPMLFSCDSDELILKVNNLEFPHIWAPEYCNMARIWFDGWDSWESTLNQLDHAANIYYASAPGYWNDLDILTVGLGAQSLVEYQSQFALWALISSPLILGNDIRKMPLEIKQIISNSELIAVNQDQLARAANIIHRSLDGSQEIWAKPLSHANKSSEISTKSAMPPANFTFTPWPVHAVVLLNRGSSSQPISLDFADLFDNKLNPHAAENPLWEAEIRDLVAGRTLGRFNGSFFAENVQPHGVLALKISLINTYPAPPMQRKKERKGHVRARIMQF